MNENLQRNLQKNLIELALSSGKKLYHPDARFIISKDPEILLYDNFLYALALLRSKTQENILEAKNLLERLFFFQQPFKELENYGSFPVALHDFPRCSDKMQPVHILTVLYWIQKEFSHVLASKKLASVIEKLIDVCLAMNMDEFPLWAKIKHAAVLYAFDKKVEFVDIDEKIIPDPTSFAQIMLAYQLAPQAIDWRPFWSLVWATWHPKACRFCGPSFRLFQDGFEQEVTLYDYFMAQFTGSLSTASGICQPGALQASLVRQDHLLCDAACLQNVYKSDVTSISIITDAKAKGSGFAPFYLLTGSHSLVIDGNLSHYQKEANRFSLFIDIDMPAIDEKEPSALSIYFDNQKDCDVQVSGKKASCFTLDEPITIKLGDLSLKATFEPISGACQFVGHISRANRKSQKQIKSRTEAYDTKLFLRAIRGATSCQIKVNLEIQEAFLV